MAQSLLSAEMARAAAALHTAIDDGEIDASSTFTWQGQDYACIGIWNETSYMGPGGMTPLDDCTIQVLKSEFWESRFNQVGDMPKLKDDIIFQGHTFRIDVIQHSAGDYIKYTMVDPAKGA